MNHTNKNIALFEAIIKEDIGNMSSNFSGFTPEHLTNVVSTGFAGNDVVDEFIKKNGHKDNKLVYASAYTK